MWRPVVKPSEFCFPVGKDGRASVHLHVTAVGQDVVMVINTMDMTGAEVAELKDGKEVTFRFGGNNCHVFNKETGINLEA